MVEISAKAISLMINYEDGSEAYYEKTEEHWDWPGSSSGPTVGVGYDCGYVSPEECKQDWGFLGEDRLAQLLRGIGKTGTQAHIFVINNRTDVTISWAEALREFTQSELPKWTARTRACLPNFDMLSPDSAGAMVSMTYNRGTEGYASPLPRFREMREIRNFMVSKQWNMIPPAIVASSRLWPNVRQLRERRRAEADLFIEGLGGCQA